MASSGTCSLCGDLDILLDNTDRQSLHHHPVIPRFPPAHPYVLLPLKSLSALDLCYTTSSVPQLLSNLWGPEKTISYVGCMLQLYFVLALGTTECVLLVVMSFDRYAAVCKPLRYSVLMNPRLCHMLAATSWICGFLDSALHSLLTFWVPLRKSPSRSLLL